MKKGSAADLSTRMAEAHVLAIGDEIGDEGGIARKHGGEQWSR